jgi:hypothetical protein
MENNKKGLCISCEVEKEQKRAQARLQIRYEKNQTILMSRN